MGVMGWWGMMMVYRMRGDVGVVEGLVDWMSWVRTHFDAVLKTMTNS